MDITEYFADKALENSRVVVRCRSNGQVSAYAEYAIQQYAMYVMEQLVLRAQFSRYEADEAAQEAANNIY